MAFISLEDMVAQTFTALSPPEQLTVVEAAKKYVFIRQPGSYVGFWSERKAPYLVEPQDEVVWAMAAGAYTNGQELTVAASGRLAAAASGNVVVAHFDQAGATLSAGDLADVCIANSYTKA